VIVLVVIVANTVSLIAASAVGIALAIFLFLSELLLIKLLLAFCLL
jgi:hypothetical protein